MDNQSPHGQYAQASDALWIWANANGTGAANAPYTFQETFDLTGLDSSTAILSGSWGADNNGLILLNGAIPLGTGELSLSGNAVSNFSEFHDFSITGGFVSGINTLEFVVTDTGNPGGLNVNNLTITAQSTPEPNSIIMLSIGIASLVGVSWARNRKMA